jgi:hypothetical protein
MKNNIKMYILNTKYIAKNIITIKSCLFNDFNNLNKQLFLFNLEISY